MVLGYVLIHKFRMGNDSLNQNTKNHTKETRQSQKFNNDLCLARCFHSLRVSLGRTTFSFIHAFICSINRSIYPVKDQLTESQRLRVRGVMKCSVVKSIEWNRKAGNSPNVRGSKMTPVFLISRLLGAM